MTENNTDSAPKPEHHQEQKHVETHIMPVGTAGKKANSDGASNDDINIDFSEIKRKITNLFKSEKKSDETNTEKTPTKRSHTFTESHTSKEEDLSIDFSRIAASAKKQAKWLIPLACILIAIIVSVYLRTMPQRLPITDDWAQNTVFNYYKNGISNQINQQYPNLPAQNKNTLIDKEWQTFYTQNKDKINNDIAQVSQQYKAQFKDDQGTLYLLGIDPWHFYRQSSYVLKNGYPGSAVKDGKSWDGYRLAPTGVYPEWDFHTWFGAALQKFVSLFANVPLMYTFFFIGTIFSALACIPAFFIGRRVTGNNVGGFFTSMLIAVSAFFVQRTTGESSDTDVYVVFFPLLITWLFLEAFEAKELKKKLLWITLAGISTGIFSFAWTGWWYVFDFILATVIIYLIYLLIKEHKQISNTIKSPLFLNTFYVTFVYVIITWIINSLFFNVKTILGAFNGPFGFMQIKAVAVNSLWPNIMTTVAELNVVPLTQVIEQLGGRLLFFLAIVGIILVFTKKDEEKNFNVKTPVFLAIWFAASLYATTKGVRFTLQATPVFAIAFGAFLGITWHYISKWLSAELKIDKRITQVVVFILLALLLIQPVQAGYRQAYNSVSSMNDAWYNTLTKIKNEAPENIIITSWWDFGYWFGAIADQPVTFDGGTQVEWGAHWVGRSLLTNNEEETTGILMMLNCGQNNAFDELDKIFNDTPKEIKVLHAILLQDKEGGIRTLKENGLTPEQITNVIKYIHCDAPVDYFITSNDMIGKAGVWGHFGSWDFNKAAMYQLTKNLDQSQAIDYLQKNFNMTLEQADSIHNQIQNTPADQWIAPWPSYASGLNPCTKASPTELSCTIGTNQGTLLADINLVNHTALIRANNQKLFPQSLVYADKENVKENKFENSPLPFSIVLVPEDSYGNSFSAMVSDPLLAVSTFTKLFFYEGHGMKCFSKFDEVKPFTGGKVTTWIVDYNCSQDTKIFFLPREEINASHILISTNGRSSEEGKRIIDDLKNNITTANFADYAKKYSEDFGSKELGGALGWFGRGAMVPEFEKAAFSLKIGEISEPIKTQFGWHLIVVQNKRLLQNG